MKTLLALALLATFVVQGAQETPSEAPGPTLSVMAPNGSGSAFPVLRGASHGVPPSLTRNEALADAAANSPGQPEAAVTPSGAIGTAIMAGNISWADPDLGGDYLATRFPRGTLVEICATDTGICIVRRTNDFGPHAGIRPNRIADLAVLDWEQICRLDRERGLCPGTVEAIEDFRLPATDTP